MKRGGYLKIMNNEFFDVLTLDDDFLSKIGLNIIKPNVYTDDRGYFFESFNKARYDERIGNIDFIQDNESMSSKGVLRGLHYQYGEFAQSKLVRVIKGSVIDFALDIRKSSEFFGKLFYIELSEDNKYQFFIPKGFAHGFLCLENNTIFSYKCDNYWNKQSERGIDIISYINSFLINKNINITFDQYILSNKDKDYPSLINAKDLF